MKTAVNTAVALEVTEQDRPFKDHELGTCLHCDHYLPSRPHERDPETGTVSIVCKRAKLHGQRVVPVQRVATPEKCTYFNRPR